MNTVDRVKTLCKERKIPISKLERECGFSNGYIGQLKKGTIPDNRLNLIADYFGVSLEYLSTGQVSPKWESNVSPIPYPDNIGYSLPVLGRVAAGVPIDAVENIVGEISVSKEIVSSGDYFALQIRGDSMMPDIHDGDIVIAKRQDDAETGDIVIAIVNGNDGCCKKLQKFDGGAILQSLNPVYDPLVFTSSDIDTIPVRIVGRVTEVRRML